MLINFSNHSMKDWPENQIKEAERLFGEIIDFPFPMIPPEIDEDQVL